VTDADPLSFGLVKLGDVADVVMGQSPKGATCNRAMDGTPLINGPTEFGPSHPVPAQWTTAPTKYAQPGDVLFCVRGSTTGRMNVADQSYCIGRGLAAIRGKELADTEFIHHALRAGLDDLLSLTTGTVFPNISGADLRGFEIPWPDEPARRRIGALLSIIERLVASYRIQRELVASLGATMFDALAESDAEWQTISVGEWRPFVYGKGLPERERVDGPVPVFGSNGIVGRHNRALVNSPGVIVGRKGTVGAVHISTVPFWPIDTTFFIATPDVRGTRLVVQALCGLGLVELVPA
jgi:restriction endonuclease S subunit